MIDLIFKNAFIDLVDSPPGSMFFVLFVALTTALISTGLTKLLVDTEEINRKQKQIKSHEEEKQKIVDMAEIDPERYRKARKRYERKGAMLKQTQQKMAMQRLKPTCVTFLPMIIIFTAIRTIFGNNPVALSPMHANDCFMIGDYIKASNNSIWINFTAWYFLCSLGINTMVQRLLKLQTQASGGMGGMFAGQKAKALEFPDV